MSIKSAIKKIIVNADKASPYPLFYPFLMSEGEKALFDECVKHSKHYLEFGLGGSSIRALQKSNAVIHTVESSTEWIQEMRKYRIVRNQQLKRLKIYPVDIGETTTWGYSTADEPQPVFEDYSSSIFNQIDHEKIDLALIDGRFRVACTLKVVQQCHQNKNLRILVHDFWDRTRYHTILKYVNTDKRADNIGLFSIKPDIDVDELNADYAKASFLFCAMP